MSGVISTLLSNQGVRSFIYAVASSAITLLTPYSTAYPIVGIGVFVFTLIENDVTKQQLSGSSTDSTDSTESTQTTTPTAPTITIPPIYGMAVGAPILATSSNTNTAPNASNYDVPLGSWVQATSSGYYYIVNGSGAFLAVTTINPLDN